MTTLAMAAVCERVHLAIGAVSGVFFTLGGGWSTVWGTLDLVHRVTDSYLLMMDGTSVGIGEALGFGMATLGSVSGGRSSWGRRVGRSMERCCVLVCRSVEFGPYLYGLVERLYRKNLIVTCNVRSFV